MNKLLNLYKVNKPLLIAELKNQKYTLEEFCDFLLIIQKEKGQVKEYAEFIDDALAIACLYDNFKLIDTLIDFGATNYNKALITASKGGNIIAMQLMMKYGADCLDDALIEAIKYEKEGAVVRLLELGAIK